MSEIGNFLVSLRYIQGDIIVIPAGMGVWEPGTNVNRKIEFACWLTKNNPAYSRAVISIPCLRVHSVLAELGAASEAALLAALDSVLASETAGFSSPPLLAAFIPEGER